MLKFYDSIVAKQNLALDKYSDEGTDLKKNHIGARWGATYSDQSLWGLEVRFMGYAYSRSYSDIAESIKTTLDSQAFPFSPEEAVKFDKLRSDGIFDKALWFSLNPTESIASIKDVRLKQIANLALSKNPLQFYKREYSKSYPPGVLLLVDWANHPFFAEDAQLQQKIRQVQERDLLLLIEYERLQPNIEKFFLDSGIKEVLFRKMGLKD